MLYGREFGISIGDNYRSVQCLNLILEAVVNRALYVKNLSHRGISYWYQCLRSSVAP